MVFYEAPHRLKDSLAALRRVLGNRDIVIGRELSKVHEEFLRGTIDEILAGLAERELKGELTIVVRGAQDTEQISQDELAAEIRRLIGAGVGVKQISESLGERYRLAKRDVYRLALRLKDAPAKS